MLVEDGKISSYCCDIFVKPWKFEVNNISIERMSGDTGTVSEELLPVSFGSVLVLDKTLGVCYGMDGTEIGICEVLLNEDKPKGEQAEFVRLLYSSNAKGVLLFLTPILSK